MLKLNKFEEQYLQEYELDKFLLENPIYFDSVVKLNQSLQGTKHIPNPEDFIGIIFQLLLRDQSLFDFLDKQRFPITDSKKVEDIIKICSKKIIQEIFEQLGKSSFLSKDIRSDKKEEEIRIILQDIMNQLSILSKRLNADEKSKNVNHSLANREDGKIKPRVLTDKEAKFIAQDIQRVNKKNSQKEVGSLIKKHPTGFKLAIVLAGIGIVGSVIGSAIFEDDISELFNEPDIVLNITTNHGEIIKSTQEYTNFKAENDPLSIELFVDIINRGKVDANNVCVKILLIPLDPNWVNFRNAEFFDDGTVKPSNEKKNRICTAVILSNSEKSTKFTIDMYSEVYHQIVSSNIKPELGFEITYDESNKKIIETYKVML